ncbi:MAG TPA: hypothetical protein VH933_14855 [Aestuariivirgaceae bacterium]|jgi:hypothetical protein
MNYENNDRDPRKGLPSAAERRRTNIPFGIEAEKEIREPDLQDPSAIIIHGRENGTDSETQ